MHTSFASPERATPDELDRMVLETGRDPILTGLLHLAEGLLVVLNEHRQVLAVNNALLRLIGVENVHDVVGLRPGEMINCAHAWDNEAGCGTGPTCASCGAAISIVTAQTTNEPCEERCVVTLKQGDARVDMCFAVRSKPIDFHGRRLILLFLRDVSAEEKRAALERVFFHDINNIITVISGVCGYMKLTDSSECAELADMMLQQTERMQGEVALQKVLMSNEIEEIELNLHNVNLCELLQELAKAMSRHVLADGRHIHYPMPDDHVFALSDPLIIERVLRNMVLNALEATQQGGVVRLDCIPGEESVRLTVWNDAYIPPSIQERIFQMHFSSKGKTGRGFGAYSMKLLGERALGGMVYYATSKTEGSTFTLELPYAPRAH